MTTSPSPSTKTDPAKKPVLQVLLVEDNRDHADLIHRALRKNSKGEMVLKWVDRLAAAIKLLEKERFDVALLDLGLPDSKGVDTCKAFSENAPGLPLIVMTAEDLGPEAVAEVFGNAEDYLPKSELSSGALLVRSIRLAVERGKRRELNLAIQAQQVELEGARKIQRELFQPESPKIPGYDMAGATSSPEGIGGDFHEFLPLSDGTLGVILGDAKAQGLAAALIMTQMSATVHALAETLHDPVDLLTAANRLLSWHLPKDQQANLFIGRLDPKRGIFNHAGAGHPTGWLIDPYSEVKRRLSKLGEEIGGEAQAQYQAPQPMTLETGDLLLLYSDGVAEIHTRDDGRDPGDEPNDMEIDFLEAEESPFGEEQLLQILRGCRVKTAEDICKIVIDAARKHHGRHNRDDMTVVAVKRL